MNNDVITYQVDVDGSRHQVSVDVVSGQITYDGEPLEVDLNQVAEADHSVLLDGRSRNVSIETGSEVGTFRVGTGNRTYDVLVRDERDKARASRPSRGGPANGQLLKAHMPGIVTQVLVAEGDTVEVGQPLLILEAMKMENELTAEAQGRVAVVHVDVGAPVSKGDDLLSIEPLSAEDSDSPAEID